MSQRAMVRLRAENAALQRLVDEMRVAGPESPAEELNRVIQQLQQELDAKTTSCNLFKEALAARNKEIKDLRGRLENAEESAADRLFESRVAEAEVERLQ